MIDYHNSKKGYIALMSVVIVAAVGMTIAISLLALGSSSSRTSFALEQSNQAKALANACAETALLNIRNSSSYTGTTGLTQGQGTCSVTVTNGTSPAKIIDASGTVGTMVRKVKVQVNSGSMDITSWQEVSAF